MTCFRDAGLEIGRLDVGDQSPLEARAQALLERCNVTRRAIARHDDLRSRLVERVECMEELLLDSLLVLEELHVVDEQEVVRAVSLLETLDSLVTQGVDEVVHERLARDVSHGEVARVLADVLRDRLHEMRLAESGTAVDEERVVGLGGCFGNGERGGVRETIRRADHEQVERVLRVHAPVLRRARRRLTNRRRGFRRNTLADRQADVAFLSRDVTDRCADQAEEVALDPLAREVVRNCEHERVVGEVLAFGLRKPRAVRGLVERPLEPTRNLVPESLRSQLDWALHAARTTPLRRWGAASIAACLRGDNGWKLGMK